MRLATIALAALGLTACADAAPLAPELESPDVAFAVTNETTQLFVPFSGSFFVPCARNNAGDFVSASGTLHIMAHTRVMDDGSAVVRSHVNPQGVQGVGEIGGERYNGTGVTWSDARFAGDQADFVDHNVFRLVGQAGAPSLHVHMMTRTTFIGGVLSTVVERSSITCG